VRAGNARPAAFVRSDSFYRFNADQRVSLSEHPKYPGIAAGPGDLEDFSVRDAVIVAAVRTPVGKRNGGLSGVHPVDLSALVLRVTTPGGTVVTSDEGIRRGGTPETLAKLKPAFAPVPLAWLAELGADPKVLNPNGGAIALGHPLGASGARAMTTLAYRMRDHGTRYGLQAMCEGGGQANATILELL
jgi:acetyl-CoA acetyltransferase